MAHIPELLSLCKVRQSSPAFGDGVASGVGGSLCVGIATKWEYRSWNEIRCDIILEVTRAVKRVMVIGWKDVWLNSGIEEASPAGDERGKSHCHTDHGDGASFHSGIHVGEREDGEQVHDEEDGEAQWSCIGRAFNLDGGDACART
ncbi:hypothetical protein C8R44DRAFT_751896 [Mycena epipterygia]|nr:hypothetical protein C8R44DRAFT_751896 [Mycena epipterygia]